MLTDPCIFVTTDEIGFPTEPHALNTQMGSQTYFLMRMDRQ